ncbi:helix-hairpin-helix domain-containing protein [bacterium]|nr:helix-hairpin-helix domain-containing protein [bacterium]
MKTLVRLVCLIAVICISFTAMAKSETTLTGVVNINAATVEQLSMLPGVGKSKAEAIIEYRTSNPFKKVEELMNIRGIGSKLLESIAPYAAVSGQTTAKFEKVDEGNKKTSKVSS